MFDKIIGFIAKIWLSYIKPYWSRFRWRKYLGGENRVQKDIFLSKNFFQIIDF